MGEEVAQQEFTREDRTRYREKVRRCLDVFARMLRESRFDADAPMTGLEIEINLVDDLGDPALKNHEALEAIADPDFQTELGATSRVTSTPCARVADARSSSEVARPAAASDGSRSPISARSEVIDSTSAADSSSPIARACLASGGRAEITDGRA